MRFSYSVVASPLHDDHIVDELTAPIRALLDELDGAPGLGVSGGANENHPHVFVIATGGTEQAVLDLVAHRRLVEPDEPVVLITHGAHNSLPAALEALAAIQQDHGRGRIVSTTGVREDDRAAVTDAIVDLEAIRRFRATKLGLIGGASSWLVASSPGADTVRRRWGPTVEIVEPERMVGSPPSDDIARRFVSVADPLRTTVDAGEVAAASAIGTALTDVVEAERFDAVAVRCFDLLADPGTSGCLALAALNDDGIVAGCEGDLPSTLAMLWIRFLLDQPAWMANPAQVDSPANRLVLAHCTVAPSMVENVALSTHFESGIGVGISGRFARQPVTLVRIGGRDLDEVWVCDGTVVASPGTDDGDEDPDLCRTQVTIELHHRSVGELLTHPLGNHLVLASGHHRSRLERWWDLAIRGEIAS